MEEQEVNFLPPELKPKRRPKVVPRKEEIEWVYQKGGNQKNNNQKENKKSPLSFRLVSKNKLVNSNKNQNNKFANTAREDLLKEINQDKDNKIKKFSIVKPVAKPATKPIIKKEKKPSLFLKFLHKKHIDKKLERPAKIIDKPIINKPKVIKNKKSIWQKFFQWRAHRIEVKKNHQEEKKMRGQLKKVKQQAKKLAPTKVDDKYSVVKESDDKDILETNLIKGQVEVIFNINKAVTINIISVIIAILIVGGVYQALCWYNLEKNKFNTDTELEHYQKEYIRLQSDIKQLGDLRIKAMEINKLLDKHVYWTNFFSYLEDNTLQGVYYKSFSGDLAGFYNLKAIAVDFPTFVNQIGFLQNNKEYIQDVEITGSELVTERYQTPSDSDGGVKTENRRVTSFDVDLKIDPQIFYK